MGYTLTDVMEAELRIRAECPDAQVERSNYGWTLRARRGLIAFTVFDSGEGRPTIMPGGDYDLDGIIRSLNAAPVRRTMH